MDNQTMRETREERECEFLANATCKSPKEIAEFVKEFDLVNLEEDECDDNGISVNQQSMKTVLFAMLRMQHRQQLQINKLLVDNGKQAERIQELERAPIAARGEMDEMDAYLDQEFDSAGW